MFSINKKLSSHKKISPTHTFNSRLASFAIIGSIFLTSPAHALVAAAADTGSFHPGVGYGANILDIVLGAWQNPDPSATGTSSVVVRIATDGRPFSCEVRQFSSSQITDTSICDTIAKIGTFPAPFGNQNPEIVITFIHGKSTPNTTTNNSNGNIPANNRNLNANAQNTQVNPILESNLPSIGSSFVTPTATPATAPIPTATAPIPSAIPTATPATAPIPTTTAPIPVATPANNLPVSSAIVPITNKDTPKMTSSGAPTPTNDLVLSANAMKEYSQGIFDQARTLIKISSTLSPGTYKSVIRVDISPDGKLKNTSVQTSSGKNEIDNEILRVLKEEVKYPPTPANDNQSIWLTFTVQQ